MRFIFWPITVTSWAANKAMDAGWNWLARKVIPLDDIKETDFENEVVA